VTLPAGNYDLVDLNTRGIHDNSISSVKVPPGFKVVAFANPDFTGASIILAGDTPSLRSKGFDHEISSLRISRFSVGATFYSDCPQADGKRDGNVVSLPAGTYTTDHLLQWGIANNSTSEVVAGSDVEVELFDGPSFGGKSRLVRGAVCLGNVNDGFDNVTSSLHIRSSKVLFEDDFNSGSLANWSPQSGTWTVENGAMVGSVGFDSYIFARPDESFNGSLVVDADVDMVTGNARYVINSTGALNENDYLIQIFSKDSPAYPNGWQIIRFKNYEISFPTVNFPGAVDAVVPSGVMIPRKCHFTVKRVGNRIDVYVNWVRIGFITDPDPLPLAGNVAVGLTWDFTGVYDNFVVRN
jgi:hypothetical protein